MPDDSDGHAANDHQSILQLERPDHCKWKLGDRVPSILRPRRKPVHLRDPHLHQRFTLRKLPIRLLHRRTSTTSHLHPRPNLTADTNSCLSYRTDRSDHPNTHLSLPRTNVGTVDGGERYVRRGKYLRNDL
jgi:hypothetical protein